MKNRKNCKLGTTRTEHFQTNENMNERKHCYTVTVWFSLEYIKDKKLR